MHLAREKSDHACRQRTQCFQIAIEEIAQGVPSPFTLEWLFDRFEQTTARRNTC